MDSYIIDTYLNPDKPWVPRTDGVFQLDDSFQLLVGQGVADSGILGMDGTAEPLHGGDWHVGFENQKAVGVGGVGEAPEVARKRGRSAALELKED